MARPISRRAVLASAVAAPAVLAAVSVHNSSDPIEILRVWHSMPNRDVTLYDVRSGSDLFRVTVTGIEMVKNRNDVAPLLLGRVENFRHGWPGQYCVRIA